tara:strand:+ start:882 stop:989 length:108 start_codon:yes stop_codon:yes gene_type:complete
MAHVNIRHTRRGIAFHIGKDDIEISLGITERKDDL